MRLSSVLTTIYISAFPALALIGHGIEMYNPSCAFACRAAIASAPLSCSEEGGRGGGHGAHGGGGVVTTPECRAGDFAFLTTLAWCINSTCAPVNVEAWRLEKYWMMKATGDVAVLPKWTYAQALQEVTEPPSREFNESDTVNSTVSVPYDSWDTEKRTMEMFEVQETLHAKYGLVLLITGFTVPILFPVLGYFPFVSGIFDKVKPYLVYPSTIGTYHVRPLPFSFGNAPTIGQSLYIAAFFILTVILTAVNYESTQPNTWFDSTWQEIMAYISCRTGVLAFALAPLVILFSGRNNILLWCTNWSHSTYILLHRWIARIFGLQVIVHSIVELELYKDMGRLDVEQKEPYWIWGIVGTLATCIMLVASLLYMRRWSYEVFLLIHITMAVFVLVGSWYHVELLFRRRWGYEFWLYAACAVWFFDRLVRIIRMAKVGIRRAKVTEVGPDIVRIDVEGVEWGIVQSGLHAYAYFPTLNPWTPWENHPFSIIPTALLHNRTVMPSVDQQQSPSRSTSSEDADIEKNANLTTTATSNEVPQHHYHREVSSSTTTGVTLYIRKSTGRTRFLKAQPHAHDQPLLTLLDGPYHNNNHDTKSLLQCDRLLLIAGGIGITALLPLFLSPGYGHHLSVKLCWSVKESVECLVRDMEPSLRRQAMGWEEKEVIIQIGTRLDLEGLVRREAEVGGWKRVGVVVCGPGGMCDVVRDVVGRIGRERQGETVFELSVEAFSW